MIKDTEQTLINALLAIRSGSNSDAVLAERMRVAFLELGSRTPDNEACVDLLDVRSVCRRVPPNNVRGITIRDRPLLVADVLSAAEGEAIPPGVQRAYPELTEPEWNACLRFIMVVMTLFEKQDWTGPEPS
jgi:hypothetical protein